MNKTFIIAEAGVNHNGNLATAENLIDAAAKAGADAVKFQTFYTENLCSKTAPKADYQNKYTRKDETQFQMLKKLELDKKAHLQLMAYADKKNIQFLSSPFDLRSIDLLDALGMNLFKIPSGEITNLPYLEKIGTLGKQVVLSTGMADLDEIQFAIETLEKSGMKLDDISLLHCCTQYPASMEEVNLLAMQTMARRFPTVRIGYSDHTVGIEVAIAAVALGARIIEKHFTLDRRMPGPDHEASLEPDELKGMVCAIRHIELALGDGIKQPSPAEIKNKTIVRKSIVASKNIKKGEKFSQLNITIKRPGTGISPVEWYTVLGKRAKRNFKAEDLISL
ncbi:MAG: N-acetylneuraminate synthase [Proteobacteria bacterium]|nr:N-acetylneuraminate synthase [Pseudomonadota bacterium]MBU1583882.1 N-acetylneuraminate synthase [Pseudomonadota bacterium]MBU2452349.1 N-acetylneuraminate synthase [Pseudomonadota bacterium]MBU2632064.1 N-acetylneuraminate synthase [Pseudomonadota bacterium]